MVSKMEGRVVLLEANLTGVREDVRKLEGWFQEMGGSNIKLTGEKDGKKFRKLQLPVFEGEDPLGWIFKVERYFTVNEISEAERL
ncbi:unnamed protein product [Withania somnifera]